MFILAVVFLTLVVGNLFWIQIRRDRIDNFKRKDIDKENDLTE